MELRALLKALGPEAAPDAAQGGTEIDVVVAETASSGGAPAEAAVAVAGEQ